MALGLTLVHFLWQAVAVAGVLAILLAASARRPASTRYGLSLAALGLMLALPIGTGIRVYTHLPSPQYSHTAAVGADHPPTTVASTGEIVGVGLADGSGSYPAIALTETVQAPGLSRDHPGIQRWILPALPWLVLFWFAGVLALSVRLMGGWAHSQRLTRIGTQSTSAGIRAVFDRLASKLRVCHTVRIVESVIVQVPAVVGWLRPVVLLPVSAAAGLTPQQLEALLAHELAHIRRSDYLVNLLQTVVETLLFYHPAVWWVSKRIREEREHCCDDLAVAVTGNVRAYAGALAELEYLRAPAAQLVAAARGGPLLRRVQRLLEPSADDARLLPRWMAGAVAVTAALLIGAGAQLSGVGAPEEENSATPKMHAAPSEGDSFEEPYVEAMETATMGSTETDSPSGQVTSADTVIVHSGEGTLSERWDWALDIARGEDFAAYWIGYAVGYNPSLEGWIRVKQSRTHVGGGTYMSGRFMGNLRGFSLPGVDLGTLVGNRPANHTALFFGFDPDGRGRSRLAQVYVSSFGLPVDLDGLPLVWLADAEDSESIGLVRGLYDEAEAIRTKDMLVSAVGIHGDSRAVVPVLIGWLEGNEPDDVRDDAADWLGYHPTQESLYALARATRGDRDRDVREEAAEAIGHLDLPAATDTLISLAQTLRDREVRSEAVESLGEKDDVRAVRALAGIARNDESREVQQEAVETLGEAPRGSGLSFVEDIARSHPSAGVRSEAIETLGEALDAERAVTVLAEFARNDSHSEVQREAVETLGEVEHERVAEILLDIAQNHASADVQEEAIETLAEVSRSPETAQMLMQVAESHARVDVQREAVETLGELLGDEATEALARIARTHPRAGVREEAIETYMESAGRDGALELLSDVAREDGSIDVQREAVEAIGQLRSNAAVAELADLARSHPRSDVRQEAVETLGEARSEVAVPALIELAERHPDGGVQQEAIETLLEVAPQATALDVLSRIVFGGTRVDVQREAVETLGKIRDRRALAVIAEVARTHPRSDVRDEALETYAESAPADSAVTLLVEMAENDPSTDVQQEAVEALSELETDAAIDAIIEIAGSHPSRRIRVEAIECLAESRHPRAEAAIRRLTGRP
jgi:HEAT repeat protein/beta-lactamase regulating signal transducer with metallopeptidase domain